MECITIHNKENDVKIAIEYCKSSGGKTMAIGNSSKMIDGGAWQTFPQPILPKPKNCYKVLYKIGFEYQGFCFISEYLKDIETHDVCWFIYPKFVSSFDEKKDKLLIFSDTVKIQKNWQRDIYNISIPNNNLKNLLNTFRESNIFYSDDLCGTDFKQVIDFRIKL